MVPDYYARLGVDPGAGTAEIEAALRKKQPLWSMGTRNPKTRHANQLYLDEIPALRRALLSDEATRAAYDAELAGAMVAERGRKLDELQRLIRLRAAKGGLSAVDREILREEAARLGLGEDDLDRLTRPIPSLKDPRPGDAAADDDDAPVDLLNPSTRSQIKLTLEHLGRRDLYDALGVFRDAPASVISSRADEERQRWMKKSQVTAEKTAWLEAISHAQSHLGTPKARVRYDRTLIHEAEADFDATVAFALRGATRLDAGTRSVLVDEAAALGISSVRADRLIGRACRRLGIPSDVLPIGDGGGPGSQPGASINGSYKLLRCRGCAGVTEMSPVARKAGTARCRHCGESLKWECPVCKKLHWVDEPRCGCGFKVMLREAVARHLSAAQEAFRTRDLNSAREHLERVLKYASRHPGARQGLARIESMEAEIGRARLAFELAMEGGRLVAALKSVEAWGRLLPPGDEEVLSARAGVSRRLRDAEALAAAARGLERTDPGAARARYRRSLDLACDLPEALAGLVRCPPDSPAALEPTVAGDRIHLTWTAPEPDGLGPLSYSVIRKRGGLPAHPGDGTKIAEVSSCEFEDRHVTPGDSVSYAVRSKRNGVESLTAVATGPVIYLADVKGLRLEAREGEVELTWAPPPGAIEVRVVRKVGFPPVGPRDGLAVPATMERALDRNLPVDQPCHYGIYAIYKGPEGQKYPAPGLRCSAWPQAPSPPPDPPRLTVTPTEPVRIEWIEPPRGTLRILRTIAPLPHPAGTRFTPEQLGDLEGRWVELTDHGRAEDPDPPFEGVCHYTPLLIAGRDVVVGHAAPFQRRGIPDPSELRATRIGPAAHDAGGGIRLQLRWQWAGGTDAVRLVARHGRTPDGPWDPDAMSATVTRDEYNRLGAWTVLLPGPEPDEPSDFELEPSSGEVMKVSTRSDPWYLRVFSLVGAEGRSVVSPGIEPTAGMVVPGPNPEVTLSYALRRPWLPFRPWTVVLRTEPPGSITPPMVVVSNPRRMPQSAEDGEILTHLPWARHGAAFAIRSRPGLGDSPVRLFTDPTVDPDSLPPIRIRHPEVDSPSRA